LSEDYESFVEENSLSPIDDTGNSMFPVFNLHVAAPDAE
jgi:hypothetical protein